jgi:hypothetical protein
LILLRLSKIWNLRILFPLQSFSRIWVQSHHNNPLLLLCPSGAHLTDIPQKNALARSASLPELIKSRQRKRKAVVISEDTVGAADGNEIGDAKAAPGKRRRDDDSIDEPIRENLFMRWRVQINEITQMRRTGEGGKPPARREERLGTRLEEDCNLSGE